jgi:hypothetical protein
MSGEARMLEGYIVREQNRAAIQWRRSCASDDALKRRIGTQLSAGPLPNSRALSPFGRGRARP